MDNQSFSKIWIIVIIIVLVGGGILAWQHWWVPKEEVKAPEIEVSEEIPEDETADWETYRNEKYGFEIKYPEDWRVVVDDFRGELNKFCPPPFFGEQNEGWLGDGGCAIKRRIWPTNDKILIEGIGEVLETEYKEKWEEKINKSIFGIYLFVFMKRITLEPDEVELGKNPRDDHWYYLSAPLTDFPEYKNVFNQMLSTFKFVGPQETERGKWFKECAREGESLCGPCECKNCCLGLVVRDVTHPCRNKNNEVVCLGSMPAYICVRCGDGICGKGEDWCVCPEDCSKPNPEDLELIKL